MDSLQRQLACLEVNINNVQEGSRKSCEQLQQLLQQIGKGESEPTQYEQLKKLVRQNSDEYVELRTFFDEMARNSMDANWYKHIEGVVKSLTKNCIDESALKDIKDQSASIQVRYRN